MLSHLHEADNSVGSDTLLSLASETLFTFYPPQPQQTILCLEVLDGLAPLLRASPRAAVPVLHVLQKGLIPWIEDKANLITDTCYNDQVRQAYTVLLLTDVVFRSFRSTAIH